MAIPFKENHKAKISSSYKPPEKLQEDRKSVYKRYNDMKNGRSIRGVSIETLWDKWERQYEAWKPPKGFDDWQSNIVPPFTTTIVEKALAEMVGQTIRPRIIGRGPEDRAKAKLMNYIFDYTWEKGDGDLVLADSLKQCLVLGKTIWQEDFFIDKREVKILKKFDPENNIEEYIKKTVYDYNDVYGEKVPLRDFFIDPVAETINRGRYKARDCIRRYVFDYDMFMEMFKGSIWDQFGASQYVKKGQRSDYYQFYEPSQGVSGEEVELFVYWNRPSDKMIMCANDVVMRDGPNPFNHKQLPFAEGSDVTRLHGFWARGEPELLESIQDELTTIRRMRIDRQHLDILKPTYVSNRELLDEDDAIVHPNAFINVDDPSNIKQPEYGDINPSAYREEELLKQDGREVTGVMNPQPSSTATEAAIVKETTMKALQMKLWRISRELVTGVARLRVPNVVQYWSAPNVEKIVGAKKASSFRRITTENVALEVGKTGELLEKTQKGDHYFDVSPDMVTPEYGGYDLKLSAEPTLPLSKPLRQQKVSEFMQNPIIASAIQSGYYSLEKAADTLSEEYDFDPDDLRTENTQEEEGVLDEEQALELANRENEAMLKGKELPGTAFAPRSHTEVHLAFMSSEEFKKKFNEKVAGIFTKHILEESRAQEARGQGEPTGGLGQAQPSPEDMMAGYQGEGIMRGDAKAANPARMMGSEAVPEGLM